MGRTWYDVAQICLNGHVVTTILKTAPKRSKRFCEKCGAATITKCPKCHVDIPGYYHVAGVRLLSEGEVSAPPYCSNCGDPYPWTEKGLEAARELITELEGLTEDEKAVLAKDLDDIMADTPKTIVAATRWKRVLSEIGREAARALREILIDIASETAKKTIWPHG